MPENRRLHRHVHIFKAMEPTEWTDEPKTGLSPFQIGAIIALICLLVVYCMWQFVRPVSASSPQPIKSAQPVPVAPVVPATSEPAKPVLPAVTSPNNSNLGNNKSSHNGSGRNSAIEGNGNNVHIGDVNITHYHNKEVVVVREVVKEVIVPVRPAPRVHVHTVCDDLNAAHTATVSQWQSIFKRD